MIAVISRTNASEVRIHMFTAEASEVGIRAGTGWPPELATTLGNGLPFVATRAHLNDDGDLEYVMYCQRLGCIELKLFND